MLRPLLLKFLLQILHLATGEIFLLSESSPLDLQHLGLDGIYLILQLSNPLVDLGGLVDLVNRWRPTDRCPSVILRVPLILNGNARVLFFLGNNFVEYFLEVCFQII
jgi:hypothetical protein